MKLRRAQDDRPLIALASVAGFLFMICGLSHKGQAAMLGVNDFYLTQQYLGTASGGDGGDRYRRVEVAMADKALRDAEINGAWFVRLSATGFDPVLPGQRGDLDLWRSDPGAYWARIDELMSALDRHSLQGVFSLIWNPEQFPAMTGETVRDLVANANSKSYALVVRYVNEYVRRYKDRHTVLFYELTNELNLGADLDLLGRCQKIQNKAACVTVGNYTTDEMIAFCRRLAMVIHNADHKVKISSGFSLPRRAAEHMRAHAEWITGNTDFTPDSPDQFEKNLREIHTMVDIIGVHIYPDPDGGENTRFGATDPRSIVTLEASIRAARKLNKPLYVGEFGDAEKDDSDDSSFTMRMMNKIAELRPEFSSPWVWELYQASPYRTHDTHESDYSMEPGMTDRQISRFRELAKSFGQPVPDGKSLKKIPPHVVLTWPLDCTLLTPSQLVYAIASDDSGRAPSVKFFLDDKQVAQKDIPPYETEITSLGVTPGNHVLKALANDATGLQAVYETPVLVGALAPGGACTRAFPPAN